MAQYHALSRLAKCIVQIVTVNVDNCRIGTILDCLHDMDFRQDNGRKLSVQSTQKVQKELISKEILFKSAKGLRCSESICGEVLRDMLKQGSYAHIASVLQQHITMPVMNKRSNPFENYQQLLRSFQMALFTHNSIETIRIIEEEYAYLFFHEEFLQNNPYHITLNAPFSEEMMDAIHPEIRLLVGLLMLERVARLLEPATDILMYIMDRYHEEILGNSTTLRLIRHNLLCGDSFLADSLAETLGGDLEAEQLSRMAWAATIRGEHQEANRLFERSIQCIAKATGKKKVFLQSEAGIFHLLSLLAEDKDSAREKALEYIKIAEKNTYPLFFLMQVIRPIFEDQLGLVPSKSHPLANEFTRHIENPLLFFLSNLVLAWSDTAAAKRNSRLIGQLRDKAYENGYIWLAAELSELLAFVGIDKAENKSVSSELHSLGETVSCVTLMKEQPKWEKTLKTLLRIAGQGTEKNASRTAEQRLVWLFSHNPKYNYSNITPRLQNLSKNGTWTKGRVVGLKNLYDNHSQMTVLTEQDHRVCRTIEESYTRSGYGYRYGKADYSFDYKQALLALVGHPLLFLENSPDVHVELVAAEPELQLIEQGGKIQLAVSPTFSGQEVVVVKDTPTRYKLIQFSQKHQDIMQVLGKGLTIPKSGEKLAGKVADSLSSMITVHSDLAATANTACKTVEADSTPHAHIIPHQDGISLEFLVKPFGTEGSSFRPGKGGKNVLTEIQGEKVQAMRDFAEENRLQEEILQSCPTFQHLEERDNQWLVEDLAETLQLLLELKECDQQVILEWPQGEKFSIRKQVSLDNLSMQIKQQRDWFKATGTLEIDDTLALDLQKLLDMLNQGTGRFVPLDDGSFLALTGQLRKRLKELQAFSEKSGKGMRFPQLATLALQDFTEEVGQLETDEAWKQHCRQLREVVNPNIPSTFQGELREYQQAGFSWLAQLSHWGVGACLADDMGLGKTIQALAAILLRASQGPTLVVAPLSVTSNWQDEARRFAPTLNVIVFGPGDRQQTIQNLQPFDLLIVSYGLLPLESELLCSVQWQTVVLDEAQAIKNAQTKRSKAAMGLQAEFRIITTGTPVENHLSELWTLFHFLNPGLLGSFKKFNEKFAIPIERDQDREVRQQLRKLLHPFILRRLKSDVLQELPAKTEVTLEVEMSEDEALLYEAQRLQALENIDAHSDEGAGQKHLRILGEITRLRRLCCHPKLVVPDCGIGGTKLKVFGDTVRELLANNHKTLVFSQFVDHLTLLREFLDAEKIPYQYLDGSTSIKKRKQRIRDFQNGEGDVFLISLKAGGAGLNLTAADYVIHMDPWWNPAVEDQASDRAHRIGQERPVTVYRLVVKNSIEEQILDLHKEKRDLAESLLKGTDAAGKVSAQELLALLQKDA
ncbi:DEAD/DEAH box helicase [Desulfogranum japonicum]|uniref:DEAD/DEAH box helicase n=1 Tax=Desulfogranum japonicum TaxID=231447 RepID=UPI0013783262|nr:DEAD/DEAH box helicase [Desulfogranum japonicum]